MLILKQLLKLTWIQSWKFQSWGWTLRSVILSGVIGAFVETLPAFSQQVNEPICYMRTAHGEIVDLTHLCSGNTVNSWVQPLPDRQAGRRPVRRGRNAAHLPYNPKD